VALAAFASAVDWWSGLYGDHPLASVAVRYLHLAGIVVGGGAALAADRRTLRALRLGEEARRTALAELASAHRVVVPALAVVVASGALMVTADRELFFASRLYWSKMGLFALLLLNGAGMVAAERSARRAAPGAWTRLGAASAASVLLWLAVLFAGVWLTVAA
jgi:hypothetical protein